MRFDHIALAGAVLSALACGGMPTMPEDEGKLASVDLFATTTQVQLGDSTVVEAWAWGTGFAEAIAFATPPVWTASPPGVVRFEPVPSASVGRASVAVFGTAVGSTVIRATYAERSDTLRFDVLPRIGAVVLSSSAITLKTGDSVRVSATVFDTAGAVIANARPNWRSDMVTFFTFPDPTSPDSKRVWLRARSPGSGELRAVVSHVPGTATVTVVP